MALLDDLRAQVLNQFGGKRPGQFGFFPPLATISGVYRQKVNAAVASKDVRAVVGITGDWADDNQNAVDAHDTYRGFGSAADEKLYNDARFMAQRNWVRPEDFQEAPLSVVQKELVESGQIVLTPEQRAEYDAAVATGATSIGLSSQIAKDIQPDKGASWITAPPAPPLPGTAPQSAPPQGTSSIGGNLPLGASSGATAIPGAPATVARTVSDIGQAQSGAQLEVRNPTTTEGAAAAIASDEQEQRQKTWLVTGGVLLLVAIVGYFAFRR